MPLDRTEHYATITKMNYDPELRHLNPIKVEKYNERTPEDSKYTTFKYAHEMERLDLTTENIIGIPIETYKEDGTGGGSKVKLILDGGKLYADESSFLDKSGTWILASSVKVRNTEGQIEEVQKRSLPNPNIFGYTNGLLTTSTYLDRTSTYIYDDLRRLEKKTDPTGIWESYGYDGLNRLEISKTKGKPGGGHEIETTYTYTIDANGPEFVETTTSFLISTPAIEDQITIAEFDEKGRSVATTKVAFTHGGQDYQISTKYDQFGRKELTCDPGSGGCSLYVYESSPLSRVVEIKPAGSPKRIVYSYSTDANGEIPGALGGLYFKSQVTNENEQTGTSYKDVFGRTVATVNALGDITRYKYNERDQQEMVIPPGASENDKNLIYEYEYNNLDLLWKKHIPGKDKPYVYTYHPDRDYLEREDLPNGHFLEYIRDLDYPSFTTDVKLDNEIINTYIPNDLTKNDWVKEETVALLDQGGTLTNKVIDFDDFGKVLQETQEYYEAPTSTFDYSYDVLDNMRTYTNNHGGQVINKTFDYDKGIRMVSSTADFPGFAGVKINSFKYNSSDWLVSNTIGNLQTLSFGYNPRGWLKNINSVESTFEIPPPDCNDPPDEGPCEREGTDDNLRVAQWSYNKVDLTSGNPTNVHIEITDSYVASNGHTYSQSEQIIIPFNNGDVQVLTNYEDQQTYYIANEEENELFQEMIIETLQQFVGTSNSSLQDVSNLSVALSQMAQAGGPGTNGPVAPGGGNGGYGAGNLFGMEIHYFDSNAELNAKDWYNGNISWIEWRVKEEVTQSYGFQYDNLNRLLGAKYKGIDQLTCEPLPPGAYDVTVSGHDERGNIGKITRNGVIDWPNPDEFPVYAQIDNLVMTYDGNEMNSVVESASDKQGYKSTGGSPKYTNGNQTLDPSFNMSTVYNYLDLPTSLTSDSGNMTFVYDANGRKLKMIKTVDQVVEETVYAGEFEYINGDVKSIHHEEGRVVYQAELPGGSSPSDYLEWNISDHLGNVRVRFTDKDGDGIPRADAEDEVKNEVLGSYHYYPFGMKMEGPWLGQQGDINKYQYNGIETFDEIASGIGLTTYRVHDAALGRWLQVDPKAEALKGDSPFCAMSDNPISHIDPEGDFALGLAAIGVGVNGLINKAKGNSFFDGWQGAAFGGFMSGGVLSAVGTAVSGHLPSANVSIGNFSFGISPALAFGSNGFSVGATGSVGFNSGDFSAGIGVGVGYTNMSLGDNIAKGFTSNIGGGVSFGGDTWSIGGYANQSFGAGIGQRVGGGRTTLAGASIAYENDGTPFGGNLGDGNDRWRTNAVSIGYGGVDFRLNMFTESQQVLLHPNQMGILKVIIQEMLICTDWVQYLLDTKVIEQAGIARVLEIHFKINLRMA